MPDVTAHPLDPLAADEIAAAVAGVRRAHDPDGQLRFVSITLAEPSKQRIAAHVPGTPSEPDQL